MDNQQVITELEKGWLCGFFDGEGYVGMNITDNYSAKKQVDTKRCTILVPRFVATNTDYPTIMRFKELCDKANIGVHIQAGRKNHPKHAPVYKATINGHKRCQKAIPLLLSGCITKKAPLQVMERWLTHRDAEYQYTLKDYEFYREFMASSGKNLNDSTLRRLYDACVAPIYKERASRRKIESGL